MTGFLGSYLHQLDDKGRLALPVSFRRAAGENGFVLVHPDERALFLYPAAAWGQVEERLGELQRRQAEARAGVRAILANALQVVPDKQGRILIPDRLQRAAELEGEALIVGVIDKIEIWNPELFESATRKGKPEFEHFRRQILI